MSEPIMLEITPYRALFGQCYRSVMRCGKYAVEGPLLKRYRRIETRFDPLRLPT